MRETEKENQVIGFAEAAASIAVIVALVIIVYIATR